MSSFVGSTSTNAQVCRFVPGSRDDTPGTVCDDVSDKTVRNTISSIYTELHAAGAGEAIVKAREAGYGKG